VFTVKTFNLFILLLNNINLEIMKLNKKTLLTSVFGLSLVLVSFNSRAIGDLEVNIDENNQLVRMEVNNPITNEIDFYLYNSNDRIIFSDRAKLDETFESQIDFSQYRNGTYTLVSETGNMRLNKVIKVKNSNIELIDRYLSYTPVFKQEGDFLKVHFINNEDSDIRIRIEDQLSTYHKAYYSNDEYRTFDRVFSLENLSTGRYTFTLSANGEEFNHTFEID
jgi:hypothetical protein